MAKTGIDVSSVNGVIPFDELKSVLPHMHWGKLKVLMVKKCYERYFKFEILGMNKKRLHV